MKSRAWLPTGSSSGAPISATSRPSGNHSPSTVRPPDTAASATPPSSATTRRCWPPRAPVGSCAAIATMRSPVGDQRGVLQRHSSSVSQRVLPSERSSSCSCGGSSSSPVESKAAIGRVHRYGRVRSITLPRRQTNAKVVPSGDHSGGSIGWPTTSNNAVMAPPLATAICAAPLRSVMNANWYPSGDQTAEWSPAIAAANGVSSPLSTSMMESCSTVASVPSGTCVVVSKTCAPSGETLACSGARTASRRSVIVVA